MRVLAIDAALSGCSVAMVEGDRVLDHRRFAGERGATAVLPGLVEALLADAPGFDAVAVGVGPGSFTGLRAALALAHGLAIGAGVPVTGVTTGEALRHGEPSDPRVVWVVVDTKRGRVTLDRSGQHSIERIDAFPVPPIPILLIGDAAAAVATVLSKAGADVVARQVDAVDAAQVGLVGARRIAGLLPPLPAQPFYAEPPEARLPAPPRPAPV